MRLLTKPHLVKLNGAWYAWPTKIDRLINKPWLYRTGTLKKALSLAAKYQGLPYTGSTTITKTMGGVVAVPRYATGGCVIEAGATGDIKDKAAQSPAQRLLEHCNKCAERVAQWPSWKRESN